MRAPVATLLALLALGAAATVWRPSSPDPAHVPGAYWVFFQPDARDHGFPSGRIERLRAAGARVRNVSRWLHAVSVESDAATRRRIARLPGVLAVRPVGRLETAAAGSGRPVFTPHARADAQTLDSLHYGPNWRAILELGVPAAHALGFTGVGIRIAILDTGFEPQHEALAGRRVIATRDFINNDPIVADEPQDPGGAEVHGTAVWSLVGGLRPGSVVGPAHGASFILAKVDDEPGDTRLDEDRWVAALEWAVDSVSPPADIVLSSVVFRTFTDKPAYDVSVLDGRTTPTSIAADSAAQRDVVLVTAMGDDGPGPGTLSAPADAASVIAVGAVDALGAPATFLTGATARGPTGDGRQKPEVSARGVGLQAASSIADNLYTPGLAGTSYAAALLAGAAAAFRQAWPPEQLSPLAVRRALRLAGNRAGNPDNAVGNGVPDLGAAIMFPDGFTTSAVTPLDPQRVATSIAPMFAWSASLVHPNLRPVRYRLEIATDPVFTRIVHSDTVREAFSLVVRTPLRPAASLWWRVVAEGVLGIRRTTPVGTPFTMPRWIRLLSPNPDEVTFVENPRPLLTWAPIEAPPPFGPFTYDIDILSGENGQPVQPTIRNVSTGSVRVPLPLVPNTAYRWRVIARTQTGAADTVESRSPFVVTSDAQPPATLLYDPFPRPFPRPDLGVMDMSIWFDIAETATVDLALYDQRGRLVRRLIPARPDCGSVTLQPGQYGRAGAGADDCLETRWDGTDQQGRRVAAGYYILRMRADGTSQTVPVVYLPRNP